MSVRVVITVKVRCSDFLMPVTLMSANSILNCHRIQTVMFYTYSFLQEKKKELQLNFEEEERRIRMKSVGNIR
jgi:hypothetical protein